METLMGSRVDITLTVDDEHGREVVVSYSQNNIYTTEDLEYAFVKAATAWGFDDYFFGYPPQDPMRESRNEQDTN